VNIFYYIFFIVIYWFFSSINTQLVLAIFSELLEVHCAHRQSMRHLTGDCKGRAHDGHVEARLQRTFPRARPASGEHE
jgi:hypothetical protein